MKEGSGQIELEKMRFYRICEESYRALLTDHPGNKNRTRTADGWTRLAAAREKIQLLFENMHRNSEH